MNGVTSTKGGLRGAGNLAIVLSQLKNFEWIFSVHLSLSFLPDYNTVIYMYIPRGI